MKTYIATIIKTNGVKVSLRYEAKNETAAYNKVLKDWKGEIKEFYNLQEA